MPHIPPVIVFGTVAFLMWGAAELTKGLKLDAPWTEPAAWAAATAGFLLGAAGVASFIRARTTVNPMHPERASRLVTSGIYSVTRNPMYAGLLLLLAAYGLWLSHPLAFLLTPLFVLWMNRFQIRPEEAALREKFGVEFAEYAKKVRRWL